MRGKRIDTPLTDEQRDLASRYMPIVYSVVSKAASRWPAYEDEILSAAEDGLMYAARTHDPARGVKFSTYAYFIVSRRCYDRLRTLWRPGSGMRVPFDPREPEPIDPRDFFRTIDDRDEFEASVRCMPKSTCRILNLLCLCDYTYSEVAKLVGLSTSAVYRKVMSAGLFYTGSTMNPP